MKFKDLIESSLSRIWAHNEKLDCAALTAFRKNFTAKENKLRNAALASDLLKNGFGVTKLNGQYPEGGTTVKEVSFFVHDIDDTGKLEAEIIKLGKKYDQDSVLIIPKGAINNKATAFLIGTNNSEDNFLSNGEKLPFEKGKLGKASKIYTSYINGKPFIFENVDEDQTIFGSGSNAQVANSFSKKL